MKNDSTSHKIVTLWTPISARVCMCVCLHTLHVFPLHLTITDVMSAISHATLLSSWAILCHASRVMLPSALPCEIDLFK